MNHAKQIQSRKPNNPSKTYNLFDSFGLAISFIMAIFIISSFQLPSTRTRESNEIRRAIEFVSASSYTPKELKQIETRDSDDTRSTGKTSSLQGEFDIKYRLPEHFEQWKIDIAEKASKRAIEKNIEPKYIISAMILESGISPSSIGDSGCSYGILQVNECVNKSERDTDKQIDLWLNNFSQEYAKHGIWQRAVVDWNSPKNAPYWYQMRYWYDYSKVLKKISNV
jgi:hypothetical protein